MPEVIINQQFNMVLDADLITLLNADWSDYESRKKNEGSNVYHFNSDVPWEIDYLVDKISNTHNKYTPKMTRRAINIICMASFIPLSREMFLEQVMGILYLL
jgi:hypothetical protein